ncbi:MAG: hypothetical protein UV89_C0033G0001, partial [candidate division WWE3 bacterium GW2011_GWB2_43_22]
LNFDSVSLEINIALMYYTVDRSLRGF